MVSMLTQNTLFSEKIASETEVTERIGELAGEIIQQFSGRDPLFVCLLRGGMPFAAQLMFAITQQDPYFNPELDYVTVSSYGNTLVPGEPRMIMDLGPKTIIADRIVIVLDDFIDKGGTYKFTKNHLKQKGASEVYLAALAQRELSEPREVNADFYCFNISSQEFLTGMGLDDPRLGKEANRWAQYVAVANRQI